MKIYEVEKVNIPEVFLRLVDHGSEPGYSGDVITLSVVDSRGIPRPLGNLLTINKTTGRIRFCDHINSGFGLELSGSNSLQHELEE